MKLIFKLIKLIIICLFIGGLFLLLTNKTFIYEKYKSDLMDKQGISIPRFMYITSNDLDSKFYTLLSSDTINKSKDNYLNNLEYCYDRYYYDKDNDITITKYEIKDNNYYRKVNISYVKDNLCNKEYLLSDMWVYEYINLSGYINGDITEESMIKLIDKIYNSKRVNILKDYESEIEINVLCDNNDTNYTLTFKDLGDNLLLVIKDKKFAVYEINDIKSYIRSLL